MRMVVPSIAAPACLAPAPVAQEPRVQRSRTHGNLSEVQRMCPACYIYIHNWSQGCSAAALTATRSETLIAAALCVQLEG